MALVPIIQPPIMRLLTSRKERLIRMPPARAVSKKELLIFPVVGVLLCCFLAPTALPLLGMLFLGNFLKECGVVNRLANTAQSAIIDTATIFLGFTVGCSTQADVFLTPKSLGIFFLGAVAFSIATACCNVNCKFCQNWEISQARPDETFNYRLPPDKVIASAIQYKMLNRSKGPAVWSPRSQNDRSQYSAAARRMVEDGEVVSMTENLRAHQSRAATAPPGLACFNDPVVGPGSVPGPGSIGTANRLPQSKGLGRGVSSRDGGRIGSWKVGCSPVRVLRKATIRAFSSGVYFRPS